MKCSCRILELPAGDVLGNAAPPVVGLQELESPYHRSEILKASGWSCGREW